MAKVIFYGTIRIQDYANYDFGNVVKEKRVEGYEPVCFCCENKFEWGSTFNGVEIMPLDKALELYPDFPILVTCFCNYDLFKDIATLPVKYNFSPDKIINRSEVDCFVTFDNDVLLKEYDRTKPIIFYGCGNLVNFYISEFLRVGIKPHYICDINEEKYGMRLAGIEVCSINHAIDMLGTDIYVVISSVHVALLASYLVSNTVITEEQILNCFNEKKRYYLSSCLFELV